MNEEQRLAIQHQESADSEKSAESETDNMDGSLHAGRSPNYHSPQAKSPNYHSQAGSPNYYSPRSKSVNYYLLWTSNPTCVLGYPNNL